jgi:hypothetical protein
MSYPSFSNVRRLQRFKENNAYWISLGSYTMSVAAPITSIELHFHIYNFAGLGGAETLQIFGSSAETLGSDAYRLFETKILRLHDLTCTSHSLITSVQFPLNGEYWANTNRTIYLAAAIDNYTYDGSFYVAIPYAWPSVESAYSDEGQAVDNPAMVVIRQRRER